MTMASVALADCISDCERNCQSLGDPNLIGQCIAACPATCNPPPPPACQTTGGVNGCSNTAITVTPSSSQFLIRNDNTGGNPKAFMTLSCKAFPNSIKTVFKGSKTVNPGGSSFQACGAGNGNAFSSTCGRNNTCSGGVN